jgi:phosphate acetyltransferase
LLTGGYEPDPAVLQLCERAFATGMPLLLTERDSYSTAAAASKIDTRVAFDDIERIQRVMNFTAEHLSIVKVLVDRAGLTRDPRLSPPAFLHMLATLAREKPRRIVLPEADDIRIIRAAAICHERNIAKCVLLGSPQEVRRLADAQGIILPDDIEIVDPTMELRLKYVDAMVELRKHKQLNRPSALAQLEDISVLGTMMLACGEVDGLVSGAVHSTANTVRPALQLIKTRPSAKLISSIFFMCLPNQVLIYGDCAINPDPNAEELADIALQSAASAESFGLEARVAMISYSTGSSGTGSDVDKVREATRIAQARRPDLLIDGPMQYDAACSMEVAKSKAPDSKVAGRATVLIFPDLNTGNTTYKAVQRTANVIAVGPMLQGLRRPVNDLSRGALVEDIVYTIALTAIQAEQAETVIDMPKVAETDKVGDHHRTSSLPVGYGFGSVHIPSSDSQDKETQRDQHSSFSHRPTLSEFQMP